MKRFLALAALVLGLAACQTEPEGLDVIVGGEVETTVCVSLPEATRANSAEGALENQVLNGNYSLRYILEVYLGENCQRHVLVSDNTSVAFPVRLAPGRDYTFVAWADIVEEKKANGDVKTEDELKADRYYNTQDGLDNISIVESTWNAMDESRDAFTSTKAVSAQDIASGAITMKLKRPFAKLRVVATDCEDVVKLGLTPASAVVTYSQKMPCKYNALEQEVTEVEATNRTHTITYDVNNHVYNDNEGEFTLFADYFFADTDHNIAKFNLDVYADANQKNLIKTNNFATEIFVEANKLTTIKGDVLTTGANINIDIENGGAMDGTINDIFAGSSAAAQAALDNAVANTTIHLESGVNYGTLVFRQNASSKVVDITDAGGDAAGNEKYRRIENLTIIGAEGAVVDGFDFQVGWIAGSGASFIDINNLKIEGVTFSGEKTAFAIDGAKGSHLGIDGLTIKNCKMTDADHKDRFVFQQISGYKPLNDKGTGEYVMTAGIKNLTITECEVTGAYMVIESRAMENLDITNNTFNGIKQRDMLITSDTSNHPDKTYTGHIIITGNISKNGEERFVRGSLNNSNAVVVITGNTIINYLGADADYIKVDGANPNNVTIANNTLQSVGASTQTAAQSALDNATVGDVIQLQPGVNYGTLIFRNTASSTVVDITSLGGDAAGNEKYRRIEDLTIIGAEGAIVDGFDFQAGYISGSGASFIDIKNLTVKNVTFSGETTPFHFESFALGIDGLTIENCKMTDADHQDRLVFQGISGYETLNDKTTTQYVMTAGVKNLTITNCEVTGAHMVIESRAMENLIITNNTFTGIKKRDMLITSDTTNSPNETYTGEITITGNTSIAGEERFIRGSLNNSDAVVVITNNTITNYAGQDADYIKVEGGNNVTIENNTISIGVIDTNAAQAALDNATAGYVIQLQPGVNYGTLEFRANPGHSNTTEVAIADAWRYNYVRTIENVKIIGAQGAKVDGILFKTGAQPGDCNNTAVIKNLTIEGVEFTDAFSASNAGYNAPIMITTSNATIDGLTVKNCKLVGNNNKLNLVYLYGADGSKNVTLSNNTVDGIARLCELRGTENVTINDNTIKNTYEHAMLLAGSNYSGRVTITGNTAENIHDRFVRMSGAEEATVIITNNQILNYQGADDDYIKVTDGNNVTIVNGTNVTIENNQFTR